MHPSMFPLAKITISIVTTFSNVEDLRKDSEKALKRTNASTVHLLIERSITLWLRTHMQRVSNTCEQRLNGETQWFCMYPTSRFHHPDKRPTDTYGVRSRIVSNRQRCQAVTIYCIRAVSRTMGQARTHKCDSRRVVQRHRAGDDKYPTSRQYFAFTAIFLVILR